MERIGRKAREKVREMKRLLFHPGIVLLSGFFIFACMALAPVEAPEGGEKEGGAAPGIIRFHVIAAGNSSQQQELKLKVRDAVLACLRPELEKAPDEAAAAACIERRLPEIEEAAVRAVREAGFSEPVRVVWGVSLFPARAYGPVVFPQGPYRALKIVIGRGAGKNWWCVLFPPLCYVDLTRTSQGLAGREQPLEADGGVCQSSPRFAWKAGEWLRKPGPRSLLSWLWLRRS
ncbi:MAG: stage II sporulation protein R [Firmicutes bacterium]|nr:stage II sporulation protein R [Bacillota bacterium]